MQIRLILLCALIATTLMGADGCPLQLGSGSPPPATTDGGVDNAPATQPFVGTWQILPEKNRLFAIRDGESVQTGIINPKDGTAQIGDQVIETATFCRRDDIACPVDILPAELQIGEVAATGQLAVMLGRRGPLEQIRKDALFVGNKQNDTVLVPLSVAQAAQGTCGLTQASLLTLNTRMDNNKREYLQGRLVLAYSGLCWTSGGNGVLDNIHSSIELSAEFTAQR